MVDKSCSQVVANDHLYLVSTANAIDVRNKLSSIENGQKRRVSAKYF